MKLASIIALGLTVVWAVLAVLELWSDIFAGDTFFKLTVTFAIVIGVVVLVALVYNEYIRARTQKDKGYID